jgi:hypothetical protein
MLQLTIKELEQLVEERLPAPLDERFEILWDDIPVGIPGDTNDQGRPSDYIEDDGRQLRWFNFRDKETGIEYDFSYVWHADWNVDFSHGVLGSMPAGIEIVKISVLNPSKLPKPEPEKVLTATELRSKEIFAPYRNLEEKGEIRQFSKELVPSKVIKATKQAVKDRCKQPCTIADIQEIVIPIAVEYKVDHKGLWRFMQGWKRS